MDRLLEFTVNHWILVAIFILLLILVFIEEARAKGLGGFGISPQKLSLMVSHEEAKVIDIRDANSFKNGHIAGAKNVPLEQFDPENKQFTAFKNKPIIIVCSTGQKSSSVASKLKKHGFENVFILTGGMAAWKQAGIPTVKK